MSAILEGLKKLPTARLSRRIVFWVFVSVIMIEAIILIPSYNNQKQEILEQLREVSSAKISLIMELTGPHASDENLLDQVRNLKAHPTILGGALYRSDGKKIGVFGEQPELAFPKIAPADFIDFRIEKDSRYDAVWSAAQLGRDYTLIIRHDASSVKQNLYGFIRRIAGLGFHHLNFRYIGGVDCFEAHRGYSHSQTQSRSDQCGPGLWSDKYFRLTQEERTIPIVHLEMI